MKGKIFKTNFAVLGYTDIRLVFQSRNLELSHFAKKACSYNILINLRRVF